MLTFLIIMHHSPVINFFFDVGIGFALCAGIVVYRRFKKKG